MPPDGTARAGPPALARRTRSLVKENGKFTLARDPHQCAFGKWFDNFKTDNIAVSEVLKKFDAPHKRIHALADEIEELLEKRCMEQVLVKFEHAPNGSLRHAPAVCRLPTDDPPLTPGAEWFQPAPMPYRLTGPPPWRNCPKRTWSSWPGKDWRCGKSLVTSVLRRRTQHTLACASRVACACPSCIHSQSAPRRPVALPRHPGRTPPRAPTRLARRDDVHPPRPRGAPGQKPR